MKKFFRLSDYRRTVDRLSLDNPVDEHGNEINPWLFRAGKRIELEGKPLIRITEPGRALEFTLTAFTVPLIHRRVVPIFDRPELQQDIQLIPATVEGAVKSYYILNALRKINCVDDARCSLVERWGPEHGVPERVGEYRDVRGLRIDYTKVGDAHVFRPWGWAIALIVSEQVKLVMEAEGITGTDFTEV